MTILLYAFLSLCFVIADLCSFKNLIIRSGSSADQENLEAKNCLGISRLRMAWLSQVGWDYLFPNFWKIRTAGGLNDDVFLVAHRPDACISTTASLISAKFIAYNNKVFVFMLWPLPSFVCFAGISLRHICLYTHFIVQFKIVNERFGYLLFSFLLHDLPFCTWAPLGIRWPFVILFRDYMRPFKWKELLVFSILYFVY